MGYTVRAFASDEELIGTYVSTEGYFLHACHVARVASAGNPEFSYRVEAENGEVLTWYVRGRRADDGFHVVHEEGAR